MEKLSYTIILVRTALREKQKYKFFEWKAFVDTVERKSAIWKINSSNDSDKGTTLETSALEILYGCIAK